MEAWEIKTDDTRTSDTITNFLLFCEGENSEPLYFQHFENIVSNIKINPMAPWKQWNRNVIKAIHYCIKNDLMELIDGRYKVRPEVNEKVWCVYDRDIQNIDPELDQEHDLEFTQSISSAYDAGMKVAWSNDAFEVWMLLHFEEIDINGGRIHRDVIYERLTEIFKTLLPRSNELNHYTENLHFSFKNFSKDRANFITHIRPRLMERTGDAIHRATILEAGFDPAVPFHERSPGTAVHHLVQAILSA